MKKEILILVLIVGAASMGLAQKGKKPADAVQMKGPSLTPTIVHPWWVVDGGGGQSTGGGLTLRSSMSQAAGERMVHLDTGMVLESGYLPGARDLCGTSASLTQNVANAWNLISVPLIVSDYRKTSLYPTAISSAFKFDNGYVTKDTLENCVGYWLKFPSSQGVLMTGTTMAFDTLAVRAGWNIIGCVSYPILISGVVPIAPVTIQSNFFAYAAGYVPKDTLLPGGGYWVKVSQAGRLVVQSGSLLEASPQGSPAIVSKGKVTLRELAQNEDVNAIVIQDATGRTQKLYFSLGRKDIDVGSCELPPPPPAGVMDVRFRSQRAAEVYDQDQGGRQSFAILIAEAEYPVTVSWTLPESGGACALQVVKESGDQQELRMDRGGVLTLDEPAMAFKLQMEGEESAQLPKEFALAQNYPNPFNPSTIIRYDLPVDSRVMLKVFNVIGQEVVTLVNQDQKAGYRSVIWNAAGMASGTYFYRLQAGGFTDVKKVLLLK